MIWCKWLMTTECRWPVSYTHLYVYKRQVYANKKRKQRKTEEALAEKTDNDEKQEIGG